MEDKAWKLGDDLDAGDNLLDGITFDDVILAVHCGCREITPKEVRKTVIEVVDMRMTDLDFLLEKNMGEIIARAKKGRGGYEGV